MAAILLGWCRKWRRKQKEQQKQIWLNLFIFQLLLIFWLLLGSVVNLIVTVSAQQNDTEINSASNYTNNNNETDSGEWEYYYEDEEDPDNATTITTSTIATTTTATTPGASNGRRGKFSNSTTHHKDDFYYYLDEEVVEKPTNGSGAKKVTKTTTLKVHGSRKGPRNNLMRMMMMNKGDPLKSASHYPFLTGIYEDEDFNGGDNLVTLPSVEPFKQLATPIEVEGPEYTDTNYANQYYQHSGPDTAIGNPLGPAEFPPNPYKAEQPDLLRPPPEIFLTHPPPVESGLNEHAEYVDGAVPDSYYNNYNDGDVYGGGVGVIGEDVKSSVFDDDIKNNHDDPLKPSVPTLHAKLKVEAYGSVLSEKHPIVKTKEFFVALWDILTHLTTAELVIWAEKAFNLVAELQVPQDHYMRVISFVGIYLFFSMLSYNSQSLMCAIENDDIPMKQWQFHAARRFVPARAVDPKMQNRFLSLFRGEDDDDDDEDGLVRDDGASGSSSSSRSSEEEFADELDHISELCPEDAFFYSLNPKHIEAYSNLQRILVAQESPKKFLKLAKRLLLKEKIHPKAWYFAIIGTFLERQDLTGFSVAHPLDAIPDWFVPADMIDKIVKKYRKLRVKRSPKYTIQHDRHRTSRTRSNVTTISNAMATISFSKEEEESLEGTPLSLPVRGPKGNYTMVTLVTSKKNKPTAAKVNVIKSLSRLPSSEETSASSSIEPSNEKTTVKKIDKQHQNEKPNNKIIKMNVDKMSNNTTKKSIIIVKVVGGGKGDKGDLTVKGRPTKGNGTYNEYLVDNRQDNHGKSSKKGKKKKCIKVNWKVGLDNGIENELWYWREDMMLNQHHWYWHQTHPVNATQHGDRRAELFFFMHRALVARYNSERLSNGLKYVQALSFREGSVIPSGYNSHLADINSGIYWTPRWPNTPFMDIHHEHDPDFAKNITLSYYDQLCGRIVQAIKTGKLLPANYPPLQISHIRGIEPLANTIEAADISVNPMFYDTMGIHALGHIMVGLSADPDFRFRKVTGVMSEAAVSMRDPAFYSYHLFMDNIFELHKERLAPYEAEGGDFPLLWRGVKIRKVQVISQGATQKNELKTFWTEHKFDLSPGVDRAIGKGKKGKKGKKGHKFAQVCAQHLDHEPFYFKIVIERQPCVKTKSNMGTVRIFMAPRYDVKGRRIPVKVQRRLMFPVDAFTVKLRVGQNTITRYAEDSSLTQPWTKSFHDFERGPDPSGAADFCGCGWPQHLYIPKGHPSGMAFDLFVMVTNYDEDHVPNDPKILEIPETCNSPYIFCGLPRRRYPDRRPMGYPFDRPLFRSLNCPPGWTFFSVVCKSVNLVINKPIDTLEEYVSKAPNMAMLKFHIRHVNEFFPEPSRHR